MTLITTEMVTTKEAVMATTNEEVKGKIVDQGPAQFQVVEQKKDYKSLINTLIVGLAGGAALGSNWSTIGSFIGAITVGILACLAEYYNLKNDYLIKIRSKSRSVTYLDAHRAITEEITTTLKGAKIATQNRKN